jgi:hypothetical protein
MSLGLEALSRHHHPSFVKGWSCALVKGELFVRALGVCGWTVYCVCERFLNLRSNCGRMKAPTEVGLLACARAEATGSGLWGVGAETTDGGLHIHRETVGENGSTLGGRESPLYVAWLGVYN